MQISAKALGISVVLFGKAKMDTFCWSLCLLGRQKRALKDMKGGKVCSKIVQNSKNPETNQMSIMRTGNKFRYILM